MPEEVQKQDRSGLWVFGVLVFILFCVGIWQLRYRLFTEDRVRNELIARLQEKSNTNVDAYLANSNEGQTLADLQNKDTDADGLNDFQEQYVYTTSPYLADSDSDGVSDPDEITAATNPNCPEGESCTQERVNTNTVTIDAESALAGLSSAQKEQLKSEVTPAQLRQQLASAGVTEAELNKLSDEQLMQLFDETLNGSTNTATSQSAIDAQAAVIRKMTVDQKKTLLVQAGVDSKTIGSLSDDQINALVEQALQDAYATVTGATPSSNSNTTNSNS